MKEGASGAVFILEFCILEFLLGGGELGGGAAASFILCSFASKLLRSFAPFFLFCSQNF
jgi:hypothetical protein